MLADVVPTDALEREVESIPDLPVASAGAVDGLLTIDLVPRKDQHAADGVAECSERFVFFLAEQLRDVLQSRPPRIRVSDRVAGQEKLTKFGAVMQGVRAVAAGDFQIEERATRQYPAP